VPHAAILLVMPIFLPIGQELGFDPMHFGVFVVTALSVEFITPPVGINLFAASAVSEQLFLDIASKTIPAFLALVVTVSIIAFLPDAVLCFR
jgi:C4-dicarboxylate transporter DctM subunit